MFSDVSEENGGDIGDTGTVNLREIFGLTHRRVTHPFFLLKKSSAAKTQSGSVVI